MYKDRLKELAKPKIVSITFDFECGDGMEQVFLRDISYKKRQDIFAARLKTIGKDENGKDIKGFDFGGDAKYMNAEMIQATLCDENGVLVAKSAAEIADWPAKLIDRLSTVIGEALGLSEKDKPKTEGEADQEEEAAENPQNGQTSSSSI